jgi:hypothetical protein
MTEQEEQGVRKYLWLNHGCPIQFLYGDDGEMQCSVLRHKSLDFKNDSITLLLKTIYEANYLQYLNSIGSIPS